jgi:hypothetical protein
MTEHIDLLQQILDENGDPNSPEFQVALDMMIKNLLQQVIAEDSKDE